MPRMICVYSLHDGIDRKSWDRFLREVDIPLTFQLPSVTAYSVSPISTMIGDGPPVHYLEIVDFMSREALRQDMQSSLWRQGMQAMLDNGMNQEVCYILDDEVKT